MYELSGELTVMVITIWWLQKLGERLVVRKPATQKVEGERFNCRRLSELEVRKQCQMKISDGFAALKNLIYSKNMGRAWQNVKEHIILSLSESRFV